MSKTANLTITALPKEPFTRVNVLGTEYSVTFCQEDVEPRLTDCDGICDDTTKEILVETYADSVGKPECKKDLSVQSRKVLRHEIVHAFLHESGLAENSSWALNEELVDWIAIQGPKIYKVWREADAL